MSGILLIVLTIVLSGLIAYLGDQIGMKMGKKRISLFGLRPRYSSIIITVLTGVLIAALSITVLFSTYSSLRQALLNINEVMTRLETLNQKLVTKDQELKNMKAEIKTKEDELNQLQKQKQGLESKLRSTQKEFEQARESLKQARSDIKNLEESKQNLNEKIASLESQRQQLDKKVAILNDKITKLTKDYEEVKKLANRYQAGMVQYMGEDIVYQRGDVIYTEVLKGGQSEDRTIKELNQFLQEANEVAKKRPIKVDNETGRALRLQTDDILNVARKIYNLKKGKKVIVSLVSTVNVPRDDWLLANFMLNEDFIVFKAGKLIASRIINADNSATNIEEDLKELLSNINSKAVRKGLLPDTQGKIGSLDFSRFYQLLNKIKAMEGQVKVEVYVSENIWREDRLNTNLKFDINRVQEDE